MAISPKDSREAAGHTPSQGGKKWRLFVGNLADSVKLEELREKFELLLQSGQNHGIRVGNVEIRCKNEDNFFGFVDVHGGSGSGEGEGPPAVLNKAIQLLNNTKWKGTLIKVQLAKESFLDKLKRERERGNSTTITATDKSAATASPLKTPFTRFPKKPDNFDFEIVSNSNKQKPIRRDGGDGGSDEEEEDDDYHEEGIPRFRGLAAFGFCTTTGEKTSEPVKKTEVEKNKVVAPSISSIPSRMLNFNKPADTAVTESISEEDRTRFERLQRIAGYPVQPGGNFARGKPQIQPENRRKTFESSSRPEPTPAPVTSQPQPPSEPSKGVVFRKHKQQNSDLLRQQSIGKMKDVKIQQHNMIKSSLAQGSIKNKFEDATDFMDGEEEEGKNATSAKKQKFSLFEYDVEEEDASEEFNLKKQYEGAEGQRLLELRGKWAFDERFKIDERFKGDPEPDILPNDEEKRLQMSILSNVLGTNVQPNQVDGKKKEKDSSSSVLIKRYDPDEEPPLSTKEEKIKVKGKLKEKEVAAVIAEEPAPELIRSTEAATYKTASNLKSLFSSEDSHSQKTTGFSLLATFGQNEEKIPKANPLDSGSTAPRQFWESNPFKYDSSDDEEDDTDTGKKSKKKAALTPAPLSLPKCNFFFKKNDARFAGLEDYFLKKDEMDSRIDYNETRRELRSIVKAKARNAKRKDEKRTLAIKRAIRKKKKYRKKLIKSGSSNSVKIGGG